MFLPCSPFPQDPSYDEIELLGDANHLPIVPDTLPAVASQPVQHTTPTVPGDAVMKEKHD